MITTTGLSSSYSEERNRFGKDEDDMNYSIPCRNCNSTSVSVRKEVVNRNTGFNLFHYNCKDCGQPSSVLEVVQDPVTLQHFVDLFKSSYNLQIADDDLRTKIFQAAKLQVDNAVEVC